MSPQSKVTGAKVGDYYGYINIGEYDNGGEGVAYHDGNGQVWVDAETKTAYNTSSGEYVNCNASAADYTGSWDPDYDTKKAAKYRGAFRAGAAENDPWIDAEGENKQDNGNCVDVTNWGYGLSGSSDDGFSTTVHNLAYIEPEEYVKYTVTVDKPGYYRLITFNNAEANATGYFGLAIDGFGNIFRSIDDKEDKEAYIDSHLRAIDSDNPSEPWNTWAWKNIGESDEDDCVVLFAKSGEQTLTLSFSESTGSFSNMLFVFVDDDIPASEFASVDNVVAQSNVAIYPNPAEGNFTVKVADNEEATVAIYNTLGAVVYSNTFTGSVEVNNNFTPGVYSVKVNTANGVKTSKLLVK